MSSCEMTSAFMVRSLRLAEEEPRPRPRPRLPRPPTWVIMWTRSLSIKDFWLSEGLTNTTHEGFTVIKLVHNQSLHILMHIVLMKMHLFSGKRS